MEKKKTLRGKRGTKSSTAYQIRKLKEGFFGRLRSESKKGGQTQGETGEAGAAVP